MTKWNPFINFNLFHWNKAPYDVNTITGLGLTSVKRTQTNTMTQSFKSANMMSVRKRTQRRASNMFRMNSMWITSFTVQLKYAWKYYDVFWCTIIFLSNLSYPFSIWEAVRWQVCRLYNILNSLVSCAIRCNVILLLVCHSAQLERLKFSNYQQLSCFW